MHEGFCSRDWILRGRDPLVGEDILSIFSNLMELRSRFGKDFGVGTDLIEIAIKASNQRRYIGVNRVMRRVLNQDYITQTHFLSQNHRITKLLLIFLFWLALFPKALLSTKSDLLSDN